LSVAFWLESRDRDEEARYYRQVACKLDKRFCDESSVPLER
jgi:primosomal replication protein N